MATKLYCVCRQPYDANDAMVQCGDCKEWFHHRCLHIDEASTFYEGEAFPCPFCNQYKQKLNHHVQSAPSLEQLTSLLQTIDLHTIKQFIMEQTKHELVDKSRSRYLKFNSINHTLHDDIIQCILQFDSNRNQHRSVCRKWNKICIKLDDITFAKIKKEIEQQNDIMKQSSVTQQMEDVKHKLYTVLKHLNKECETRKKMIRNKYSKLLEDIANLSPYQCHRCEQNGYENATTVTCDTCKKECEICDCIMRARRCASGCVFGGFFCSKSCDKRGMCKGCSRALCDQCEVKKCDDCDETICGVCLRFYDKYAQCASASRLSGSSGSSPLDNDTTTVSLCPSCFENYNMSIVNT